jgi:hypothetical protein
MIDEILLLRSPNTKCLEGEYVDSPYLKGARSTIHRRYEEGNVTQELPRKWKGNGCEQGPFQITTAKTKSTSPILELKSQNLESESFYTCCAA